ncbi:MAG: DNA alkylation repair protein [Alphaproteobacteria bacterium]|nr:DNA alkylation repair protein [Alphaproteobacteria bacterium]
MAEPMKNVFNREVIAAAADYLFGASTDFDKHRFVTLATDGLEALELKERSEQIHDALVVCLPDDYLAAVDVLLASLAVALPEEPIPVEMPASGIAGWMIMPMSLYVARHYGEHFQVAMAALKELTKRFTSEFAIRYLIISDQARAIDIFQDWVRDENHHVRRLVSEGIRPRLPWAMQLPELIREPRPILPLLDELKDDPSEYVRRSVANNLNDIAKDHPDLVAEIAAQWLEGASRDRERLVKHACRTLIKQGHPGTLSAFGYGRPALAEAMIEIRTPTVVFGNSLEFGVSLKSSGNKKQKLIIDYAVHFVKANGKLAPKVFKGRTVSLEGGAAFSFESKHPIKPITTRKYYAGPHKLEVLVNGESVAVASFDLQVP